MEIIKNNRKKILTLCVVLVITFVAWQIFLAMTFRLVSISPNPNKIVASSVEIFQLNFNQELDRSIDYKKQFADSSIVNSITVNKSSLLLNLKTLDSSKKYSFSVKNIQAVNGKIIEEIKIEFTTKYIPYNELSSEQQEIQLKQTDAGNIEDPLDSHLPHSDLGYYLTGQFNDVGGNVKYTLLARITLSSADVKTGRDQAINTQKQLISDFIRSKGLDPSKYSVSYEVVDPPF